MNEILKVKKLFKTFNGIKVLNDINFDLKVGEKIALIGSDGSGKTTLLRLILGLLVSDDACKNNNDSILIDGLSPFLNLKKIKNLIGYMPQSFGLYEDLSVIENLYFYSKLKGVEINKGSLEELLEFSNLFNFKDRLAKNLSGGMKQKLGLSCVLLSKPKLLLLDEPSVGVDPISRRDLIEITEKLSLENKISIIWATSYLDEAQYFNKTLLLNNGKVAYWGSVDIAKEKMRGLSYSIKCNIRETRVLINKILENEKGVVDCSIQKEGLRVVFSDKKSADNFSFKKEEAEPIFEDFVVSVFGGIKSVFLNKKEIKTEFLNDNFIDVIDLEKRYGNFIAATNINFQVKKGEIFGLLGPNGAGKSTTFKMLCGLIKPTKGNSKILGYDIQKESVLAKKNIGYMAQKFSLFGNLSVKQNIDFFKGVYGVENLSTDEIARSYELEKYLKFMAKDLPLGFKQRLSLLCATIHNPAVLFLDEPTSGVDVISRREFWIRINNLVKNGTSVLVTTHFMDEAQFCDRVALIYQGKILIIDTPFNLIDLVKSEKIKNPTMEDAFIQIIKGNKNE